MLGLLTPDKESRGEPAATDPTRLEGSVSDLGKRVDTLSTTLEGLANNHKTSIDNLNAKVDRIIDGLNTLMTSGGGGGGLADMSLEVDTRRMSAAEAMAVEQSIKDQRDAKRRENMLSKMAKEEIFGVTMKEQEELSKSKPKYAYLRRGILLPTGTFRQTWDLIFLVAIGYIVLIFPYRIAFVTEHSVTYAIIDFVLDMFFISDIFLSFVTAYIDTDRQVLVTSHRHIARHYMWTWLVPDLISSIPYDWFILGIKFHEDPTSAQESDSNLSQLPQLLRIVKCIKLLRLLRIAKIGRYIQKVLEKLSLEVILNSNVLRLFSVGAFMTVFAHWNSCVQYMIVTFDSPILFVNGTQTYDYHPDSWVYRMIEDGSVHVDLSNLYRWSFYGAWMQMLAIAVGLKEPRRESEMWGTLVSILCGSVIYALFLASLTTAVAESDQSAKEYRKKLNMMNEYMKYAQVPKKLRDHMRSYYELFFPAKRSFDERAILAELSKPLRAKVALYKCRAVLDALQLISAESSEETMSGLMESISIHLERVLYVNGDFVIRSGDEADGMYFISKGFAEVLSKTGTVVTTLGRGSFFGEMALLEPGKKTTASVQVTSFCDTFFLSVTAFNRLVAMYPSFHKYLQAVAKLREGHTLKRTSTMSRMNKAGKAFHAVKAFSGAANAVKAIQAAKLAAGSVPLPAAGASDAAPALASV